MKTAHVCICRRFAPSALLALCLTRAAHAGDVLYLRWDNCFGDGGVYNKTFACDTNSGSEILVGSFRLAATADSVSALEIVVDLAALGPTMPAWWSMRASGPVGCRTTSLSQIVSPPVTSTACLDLWTPLGAVGGINEDPPSGNTARIHSLVGLPFGNWGTVQAGQEDFAFQLRIDHARTTGSGACAGCSTPVCIAWGQARVRRGSAVPLLPILGATTPGNGSNVTWQSGAVATTVGDCPPDNYCPPLVMCQSVTPAHDSTWGSIKSLYRR